MFGRAGKPRAATRNQPRKGASQQQTPAIARLEAWSGHHRELLRDSLRRLVATPAATAMTWLVIGIALALPGTFQLALDNLRSLLGDWDTNAQLSVFLQQELEPSRRDQLVVDLRARGDVATVELITPEDALAELGGDAGFTDVLEGLARNPLPAVLVVTPGAEQDLATATGILHAALAVLPEVDRVVVDLQWLQRLRELMTLADRAAMALAVLLASGVVLVLGNTIRLEIENRRNEIQVVKLVGGTDAFVRRPFLYMGFWYGLGGGLTAVLLVLTISIWMGGPLGRLLSLYGSEVQPEGPGLGLVCLLTGGAACLGLFGAWFAVGRHLDSLQPD